MSGTFIDALADADDQRDAIRASDVAERARGVARNGDAVFGELAVDSLGRRVIPERDVSADVEPDGIAGQPRLGKDDECGALRSGFGGAGRRRGKSGGERVWNEGLDDGGGELGHASRLLQIPRYRHQCGGEENEDDDGLRRRRESRLKPQHLLRLDCRGCASRRLYVGVELGERIGRAT